nr:DUF6206 family protein [Candidatus Sigynarchaeota archaeon]
MEIDKEIIAEFERTIDTVHPDKGGIPINILGFGEISLVFEFTSGKNTGYAFKRLPIFDSEEQVTRHVKAFLEYNKLLSEKIGIRVPEASTAWFPACNGKITLYCIQERIDPASVGNKVIHVVSTNEVGMFVRSVLSELKKIWAFNKTNPNIQVGIDGQISNWCIKNFDGMHLPDSIILDYLDTSTPMFRVDGVEQMDAVLFLKSAPGVTRGALMGMLEEVVNRYYDFRLVINDLIANFYKEQLPGAIPDVISVVNEFIGNEIPDYGIAPFTVDEIKSYYKRDKQIWTIFQGLRRFDRFVKTKIMRKTYDFYLPGKIKR